MHSQFPPWIDAANAAFGLSGWSEPHDDTRSTYGSVGDFDIDAQYNDEGFFLRIGDWELSFGSFFGDPESLEIAWVGDWNHDDLRPVIEPSDAIIAIFRDFDRLADGRFLTWMHQRENDPMIRRWLAAWDAPPSARPAP